MKAMTHPPCLIKDISWHRFYINLLLPRTIIKLLFLIKLSMLQILPANFVKMKKSTPNYKTNWLTSWLPLIKNLRYMSFSCLLTNIKVRNAPDWNNLDNLTILPQPRVNNQTPPNPLAKNIMPLLRDPPKSNNSKLRQMT